MIEEGGPTDVVDRPTRRLGTYMALLAVLQGAVVFIDGNVPDSFVAPTVLALVLSLALRGGRRWARTVLIVMSCLGVGLLLLGPVFGGEQLTDRAAGLGWALATVLDIVALAFTVPEAGVGLGLPERWRPWATSRDFHLVVLGTGIVGLLVPA